MIMELEAYPTHPTSENNPKEWPSTCMLRQYAHAYADTTVANKRGPQFAPRTTTHSGLPKTNERESSVCDTVPSSSTQYHCFTSLNPNFPKTA